MQNLINKRDFFCFETNKFDNDNFKSYYFFDPVKIFKLEDPSNINAFFSSLEEASRKYYLAGYFSYELGYNLEKAFEKKGLFHGKCTSIPLAYFCAYEKPIIYDHRANNFYNESPDFISEKENYEISGIKLNISEKDYLKNIEKIKEYIRQGDIYQANYTIKYKFNFSGSPWAFYLDLKRKQNVSYNVFALFDKYYILSLTPELFLHKSGNRLIVKPMKGTVKRGRYLEEDNTHSNFLRNDEKNQSENVMIVDLLRNDIGKISREGTVKVKKLYEIEKYNTLFQMTSTIESTLNNNISIFQLIKSTFPSGSVTGAPKIRSMEIIKELETEERGIYTGSIGFFEPTGDAKFNVAIRTIIIDGSLGEMGIGGGIVYDSTPEGEFMECKLKGKFLTTKPEKEFSLIETMLYNGTYRHVDFHLERLMESAEYFDFRFEKDHFLNLLEETKPKLTPGKHKVRALIAKTGEIEISYEKLQDIKQKYNLTISRQRIDSNDIYIFHKTTNRDFYNEELKKARESDYFDIIFLNEKEQITEGSITNIYIQKNKQIYTPPVDCGLLNGTMRRFLLKKNFAVEKNITLEDLKTADKIYISNAIIGLRKVCDIEIPAFR